MMDHPSYAIILHIFIPLIFQKYTKKNHHLYCHFPHLKVLVKSATCLEYTTQNRGVRCVCTYAWAHNTGFFFSWVDRGPPIRRKFCQFPPIRHLSPFLDQGLSPPPQPRFVPENLKNLNSFLCQI